MYSARFCCLSLSLSLSLSLYREGGKESHPSTRTHSGEGGVAGSDQVPGPGDEDEEDFDQHCELQEAVQLLCRAVECLGALINKEIVAAADRDSASKTRTKCGTETESNRHNGGDSERTPSHTDTSPTTDDGEEEGDGDDWEGMSGRGGIVETLAVQLAGVLHKLVQGASVRPLRCWSAP